MGIKESLDAEIKRAMINKDAARLSALRMIKAEVVRAEKDGAGDEAGAVRRFVKQCQQAVEAFDLAGAVDRSAAETASIAVAEEFLPKGPSDDQVIAVVEKYAAGKTKADFGAVMKAVKAELPTADMRAVSDMVKKRIGT